jgi:hypothetical protein
MADALKQRIQSAVIKMQLDAKEEPAPQDVIYLPVDRKKRK